MNTSKPVLVGGAAMYSSRNIIHKAVHSKGSHHPGHRGEGRRRGRRPVGQGSVHRVCADHEACAALPAGTVENLVQPENKATLAKILTCRVVAARQPAHDLAKAVVDGGKAMLKTAADDPLTLSKNGDP